MNLSGIEQEYGSGDLLDNRSYCSFVRGRNLNLDPIAKGPGGPKKKARDRLGSRAKVEALSYFSKRTFRLILRRPSGDQP